MGVGGWLCAVCGFMGIIYSFILTGNQVYIEVCVIDGDGEFVLFCVADVIADICRVINKESEAFFPDYHQEIMCAIEGYFFFGVVRVIGAAAYILVAALVDAAVCFAKTIHCVVLRHVACEGESFFKV